VLLHASIAGIDYLVNAPSGVRIRARYPVRRGFASCHPSSVEGIRVDLLVGEMPDPRSWRALASHGPDWSIRQQGAERCLCLGEADDHGAADRIACWKPGERHATVHVRRANPAARADDIPEMSDVAGYPVDQMLLMYYLASRRGLLVHAAGLAVDGRALIFPGVSGAGKSTLTRQFLARDWPTLLSDDRVIVREMGGGHLAFGTPWPGDAGVAVNASAPLAAILFPAKGEETHIRALSPQAALDRLLPATSILWFEPELLAGQLETCERMLREVPAFELAWSPAAGVVDDVLEFVRRL
jgi:hypothetical protein